MLTPKATVIPRGEHRPLPSPSLVKSDNAFSQEFIQLVVKWMDGVPMPLLPRGQATIKRLFRRRGRRVAFIGLVWVGLARLG